MDPLSAPSLLSEPSLLAAGVVVALWWAVLFRLRGTLWRVALVGWGGTVLHELMHFGVGWLLRARPSSISFFPRRNEEGTWALGSVTFERATLWNSAPVALAPLLMLPLGLALLVWALTPALAEGHFALAFGLGYVVACCLHGCLPSCTDWRMGGWSILLYGSAIGLLSLPFAVV